MQQGASTMHLVCIWDAWPMHEQGPHGAKCVKHATNNQNMINMHNHGNPQKLILIKVQNNEKMSFGHFIKHLECTHYTCMLNNAWTYENLA